MTDQELADLISDVRDGRTEDEFMELKRAWWDFTRPQSFEEFVKDISAMSNSLSDRSRVRHIIVGVSERGELHAAPLPCDEAELQQRVHQRIEPTPSVRFLPRLAESVPITIIEISPPFDSPYVGLDANKQHRVWVRLGSRIVTAGRRHLDRMFAARNVQRAPQIVVGWRTEAIAGIDDERAPESLPTVGGLDRSITLRAPSRASYVDLVADVEAAKRLLDEDRADGFTFDEAEESAYLAALEAQAEWLTRDSANARALYLWRHREEGTGLRLGVANAGTAPATRIRLSVSLPDWVALLKSPPQRPEGMPSEVRRPDALEEKEQARQLAQRFTLGFDTDGPLAQMMAAMNAFSASPAATMALSVPYSRFDATEAIRRQWAWYSEFDDGVLTAGVAEVLQDHEEYDEDPWFLVALPGAPQGRHAVSYTLFHAELERHVAGTLEIVVE